jgi:hypothetical protein
MSFQKMQWLFPIAVTLHNGEEAVWMPGWSSQHASQLPMHPPGTIEIRTALIVLTVAAIAVTFLSDGKGPRSFWSYLMFGGIVAMLVNVFVPHLPATLWFRSYTPGVLTAVFINLPLMSYLAWLAVREQWVSGGRAVAFGLGVPFALGGAILLLMVFGAS